MSELDDVERDFLIEGLDDWIGLWRFARSVRDERPDGTSDEVRERSMPMVRELVVGGYMRPGRLTEDRPGFSEWEEDAEAAVERIEREWRELGRDPNIPDVCWFSNTELGDRVARESLAARSG